MALFHTCGVLLCETVQLCLAETSLANLPLYPASPKPRPNALWNAAPFEEDDFL